MVRIKSAAKKVLTILIALTLFLSMLPSFALAEGTEATEPVGDPVGNGAVQMVITGFEPLESNQFRLAAKLPVEEIQFPTQLSVYIDHADHTVSIPVSWVCQDDYAHMDYELYTFTPVWEPEAYRLADDADPATVPYVEVFILHAENPNARAGDDVTPEAADYEISNGAITGLKDSFLTQLSDTQKQNIHLVIPGEVAGQSVTAIAKDAFKLFYTTKYTGCRFVSLDLSGAAGLTSIGESAFYAAADLSGSLTIPGGVTEIGKNAFRECKGFTGTLQLSQNLRSIGDYAFFDCGFSGVLRLPEGLISIGSNAFKISSAGLTGFSGELCIPASVQTIGSVAFSGHKNLTSLRFLGSALTEIADSVFRYCGLNGAVTIPASVQKLGANVFDSTNLKTIYLPKRADAENTAFIRTNTFGTASSSKLTAIVCDQADYEAVCNMVGTSFAKKVGYEMTVHFSDGGSDAFTPISRLFNLPFNYVKDGQGVWSADSTYRFPEVQGKKWGLTSAAVSPVLESDLVKQDRLYAIASLADPVITFGAGIDKGYDGLPAALTVNAAHPLAKPIGEAGVGDVVFYYTWSWDTMTASSAVLTGFDKNVYEVTDVREPRFAIACRVRVQACLVNDSLKAVPFYTVDHEFVVYLRQAEPLVRPVFKASGLNIQDGMPPISLTEGDAPGSIQWDAGQTLQLGKGEYTWTFTPAANAVGNCNYTTKTGTAELFGVDGTGFEITVLQAAHGRISPSGTVEAAQGADVAFQFQPDAGYKLERVLIDGNPAAGEVVQDVYTLSNVQQNHTISAVFTLLSAGDVENVITQLPVIPNGSTPTEAQKDSILYAKLQYEALPDSAQKSVSMTAKAALCDAIAQLPQVHIQVEGALRLSNQNLLLENMTPEDAQKLQEDSTSSFYLQVVTQEAQPSLAESAAIGQQLNGAKTYQSMDISVVKSLVTSGGTTRQTLSALRTPVQLVFPVANEIKTPPAGYSREFLVIRAHRDGGGISAVVLPDLDSNAATITVESNQFSLYTIAYRDRKNSADFPRVYTITAEAGRNGSVSPTGQIRVKEGESQTFCFTPNQGYRVRQVLVDGYDAGAPSSYTFSNVRSAHQLQVLFERIPYIGETTYTVVFDSRGGSSVPAVHNLKYGAKMQEPAEPKRNGYVFAGWYADLDGKRMWNFEQDTVTSNLTLYAGWKAEQGAGSSSQEPDGIPETGARLDCRKLGLVALASLMATVLLASCMIRMKRGRNR